MKYLNQISRKPRTSEEAQSQGETSGGNQPLEASTSRREVGVNTLEVTIQLIQQVTALVPINTAKNVLTGITSILLLVQKNINNKVNLTELAQSCEYISSTLVQATKGLSMDEMSEALTTALSALQSSIDQLRAKVDEAFQRGHIRRLIGAGLDEKQISGWTGELDRIQTLFSTRVNIVGAIRLDRMYHVLMRSEIPSLIPEPPPPPPAMFFGREYLYAQVKDALLRDEGVALIGPGGIGKSCIAKAVINDDDIKTRYTRRFFVSYDGMDPVTITLGSFIDRIASALGLPMLGAKSQSQVITNLELSSVLLALDNAETFEDAANQDSVEQISSFISDIANTHGVTVILTSRTSRSARLASWKEVRVPPLEKVPARHYFRKIFHGDIEDDDIDNVLTALDFHPLSIHILAYSARESQWTGEDLLDEWNIHQSRLLQAGHGKENLGFTIGMSLSSPSVKSLGDKAINVLCTIAFFPQGVNRKYIARLFPSIPQISLLVDALCKVSLVHRSGTFLTTLAPIRLFLLDAFPTAGLELLGDIRRTYYDSLKAISKKMDSHAALIISDYLNIEYLITSDFSHTPSDSDVDATLACRKFLKGLAHHKLRPTSLSPSISSLSEGSLREKESKAHCLQALGYLYLELSNHSFAGTAYSHASKLFVAVGNHETASYCTSDAAMSYNNRGYFSQARQVLEDFIHSPSWRRINDKYKAGIYATLDRTRMRTSSESADKLFLRSMDHSNRGLQSRIRHWRARMYHGYNTPEEVVRNLESIRSRCMSSPLPWHHWNFLGALADAAFLQGRVDIAMEHLNQAYDSVQSNFLLPLNVLSHQAAVASVQGNYELARSLLQHALDTLSVVATPSSNEFLEMRYVHGRNELYANNHSEARRLLANVIVDCDAQDNMIIKTRCTRALGEVEIHLGSKTDSDRYFAQTVRLCKESGIPPALLDICEPMMKLDDDKFPGWKTFLRAQTG